MWIRNKHTGNVFDIEDQDILNRCLKSGEYERANPQGQQKPALETPAGETAKPETVGALEIELGKRKAGAKRANNR